MQTMTQKKLDKQIKEGNLEVIYEVKKDLKEIRWFSGFREYVQIEEKEKCNATRT